MSAPMSKAVFNHFLAEATAKLGPVTVQACLEDASDHYGWPIPPRARGTVVLALTVLIDTLTHEKRTLH